MAVTCPDCACVVAAEDGLASQVLCLNCVSGAASRQKQQRERAPFVGCVEISPESVHYYAARGVRVRHGLEDLLDGYWIEVWEREVLRLCIGVLDTEASVVVRALRGMPRAERDRRIEALQAAEELAHGSAAPVQIAKHWAAEWAAVWGTAR